MVIHDTECPYWDQVSLTLTLPGSSAGVSGSLDSYCSLKPLCSGMGEVVPAHTSPTLLPHPLALCCHYSVSKCCSASIVVTSTVRVKQQKLQTPCNYFCYTQPLICLLCCSVKDDVPPVVIASKNDVFDELYDDNTEDSCELWGCVLMLEYMYMLLCSRMVMSFRLAGDIVLPKLQYLYLSQV